MANQYQKEEIEVTPINPRKSEGAFPHTLKRRIPGFESVCSESEEKLKERFNPPELHHPINLQKYSDMKGKDDSYLTLHVKKILSQFRREFAYGEITAMKMPPSLDLSIGSNVSVLCHQEIKGLV
eukprot:CAMPEP_0168330080 /NCGR_PEP_ID=MMETSP0213-20121227/7497_1 /TAXON_ID=151035 /ORGANISM="Euplotes harpa, Strain FSP1.4" /LENGTH=124 /DNA_ID=CAMNT_0008333541 /DNA_START=193 /DNA_END=563 /DNA_ORIENTATION=+